MDSRERAKQTVQETPADMGTDGQTRQAQRDKWTHNDTAWKHASSTLQPRTWNTVYCRVSTDDYSL